MASNETPYERKTMISVKCEIINELGHRIEIEIFRDVTGVTLRVIGPDSFIEHVYTPLEAKTIREMLELLEPLIKKDAV